MPNIEKIIADLKAFLKDANGWDKIDIPFGENAQVVCLPQNKSRNKALALVRNPNKKKSGTFYASMEQFIVDAEDFENNSDNYLTVLKAIENINGKSPAPKKETELNWS